MKCFRNLLRMFFYRTSKFQFMFVSHEFEFMLISLSFKQHYTDKYIIYRKLVWAECYKNVYATYIMFYSFSTNDKKKEKKSFSSSSFSPWIFFLFSLLTLTNTRIYFVRCQNKTAYKKIGQFQFLFYYIDIHIHVVSVRLHQLFRLLNIYLIILFV